MKNKIILPNGHLSWSSLNCWITNQTRFRKEYFERGDKIDSRAMRFGKGFAAIMEDVSEHPELLKDKTWMMNKFGLDIESQEGKEFVENLKFYDMSEFEITCNVKGVPILSFIDSYNSETNNFFEYKTGRHPWTQSKVQKHDQLTFYATALKYSVGKMPEECELLWVETKEGTGAVEDFWRSDENKINVTGKIKSFKREFDEREIERMEDLIVKCATEISEAYIKFIEEI